MSSTEGDIGRPAGSGDETAEPCIRREILVVLLIGAVPLFLVNGFFSSPALEEPPPLLPHIEHPASGAITLAAYALFLLAPWIAMARARRGPAHFGLKWTGTGAIGHGLICFVLNYLVAWAVWIAYLATGFPLGEESIRAFHYVHAASLGEAIALVPWYLAVVAAEESFARCYLLTRLRDAGHGAAAAVVLSSLAYTFWHPHWGLAGAVHVFAGGLLFGAYFVKCGGVVAPAVAHFVFDALTLLPR